MVCWEQMDSASSLAKGPAKVCHSAQPAAGLEGLDKRTGSWEGMGVWLEGKEKVEQ